MANDFANIKVSLSYVGPSGEAIVAPSALLSAPYRAQSVGAIDVPVGTAAAAEFAVPFGSIGVGATLVVIENRSGQALGVKLNGTVGAGTASHQIANKGVEAFAAGALTSAAQVKSLVLVTTVDQTVALGSGTIAFRVFGDPE